MYKNSIKAFAFRCLTLPPFFELADILVNKALPADVADELGLGVSYHNAKQSFEKLKGIFQYNPAMRQTKDVVETVTKIRRKMMLFKRILREMVLDTAAGERLENIRHIRYIAHPCLGEIQHGAMAGVVAKARKMADALRTTETLPKLTGLGLTAIVNDIATLSARADNLLFLRGEETAFKRARGTACKVRKTLEKQLRFLFYIYIPAHYVDAAGPLAAKYERTILEINGTLDIYRHLTKGGSRKGFEN